MLEINRSNIYYKPRLVPDKNKFCEYKSEAIATHSNKNKFCEYNIYIERFWRTIKQEEIYINPSNNLEELRIQIDRFIKFYNYQRPHQALKYKTPSQVFYNDENRKKRLNF